MSDKNRQENPGIRKDLGQEEQTLNQETGKPDDLETVEVDQPEAEEQVDKKEQDTSGEQPVKTQAELLEEKINSLNDQLLRTAAEYDNFRRRSQREKEQIYPQATAHTVEQILPVMDNVERALAVECSDPEFKKGIEMILQSFREALQKLDVQAFGEAGDLFDPELHNAVMHVEDEQHDANTVVTVFQKGYRLGDKIIRHAMVQVAN